MGNDANKAHYILKENGVYNVYLGMRSNIADPVSVMKLDPRRKLELVDTCDTYEEAKQYIY